MLRNNIIDLLKRGHDYILFPKAVSNVPLGMSEFDNMSEDYEVVGSYNFDDFCAEVNNSGYKYSPIEYTINGNEYYVVHYSLDRMNDEELLVYEEFEASGLVKLTTTRNLDVLELVDFQPNTYAVFSAYQMSLFSKRIDEINPDAENKI